jgi:hypothetical protein
MTRSGFTERQFVCVLCGDRFTALGGSTEVQNPVCMSCGLRWPAEKLKRLILEKKSKKRAR